MAVILQFPTGRIAPAQPSERGHRCFILPLPGQARNTPLADAEKPKKKTRAGSRKPKTQRDILISKVKIAQKQLGISDPDYRFLLQVNFDAASSTELNERDLIRLIDFFRSKGWQDKPARGVKDSHGKPKAMKDPSSPIAPMLGRIEAILSQLGNVWGRYVPWSYAAGILQKHTGFAVLDAATVRELQKVMVALECTLERERGKQAGAGE